MGASTQKGVIIVAIEITVTCKRTYFDSRRVLKNILEPYFVVIFSSTMKRNCLPD